VPPATQRIVALGASNLTRGLLALTSAADHAFGPKLEVFAALGHGRSYGLRSAFLGRSLPSVLECGLWDALAKRDPAPTRALLTDVGNDILYGAPAARILEWVETSLRRLRPLCQEVVVAGLPLQSIRRLPTWRFLLFRSLLFPRCRLSTAQVLEESQTVDAGLRESAERYGARYFPLPPEWYGFDPIHIMPRFWPTAWQEILGCPEENASPSAGPFREWLRLYRLPPERQWLFGREQVRPQQGASLRGGGRLWLY
jgi:hypothetical protein